MSTSTISVKDTSRIQICLLELSGKGYVIVNDRHFALKIGQTVDITASLTAGVNIINFIVKIDSIQTHPSKLLTGNNQWLGRFEIYVDGDVAGSYVDQGNYLIGGKEKIVASVEVNLVKDATRPTIMQLVNQFQGVEGMTDANRRDFPKSHPHILFKNGIGIHLWKNTAGVDHVFLVDRSGNCVYGGYVGWLHSQSLKDCLQKLHGEYKELIA